MLTGPYGRSRYPSAGLFGVKVGEYVLPPTVQHANITPGTTARVYFFPYVLPRGFVCDQIAFNLQTVQAGAELRVALFSNHPRDGMPEDLLLDAGIVDLSSGTGLKTITVAKALPERVWGAVHMKNVATQATLSGSTNALASVGLPSESSLITSATSPRQVGVDAAYGSAFPAKATTLGVLGRASATNAPFVFLRRA